MAILLPLLARLLPILAALGLVWYGWHRIDNWCNGACVDERERGAELSVMLSDAEERIVAAQERATALALLWAKEVDNVKVRHVRVIEYRKADFGGAREAAGRIRLVTDGVAVRVPPDAARLLGDVADAANDTAAAGRDTQPAQAVPDAAGSDTTLTQWIAFATDAAEAYRDAADKHQACVAAYDTLRADVGTITEGTTDGQDQGRL